MDVKAVIASGGLIVAALAVLECGCERAPKLRPGWAIVSGTVTYKSQPLPGGQVIWCTDKDGATIMRGGPIRQNGTFVLDAPIGPARVAIDNREVKNIDASRYVEIPAKYVDVDKSGLKFEVNEGENKDMKIELQ